MEGSYGLFGAPYNKYFYLGSNLLGVNSVFLTPRAHIWMIFDRKEHGRIREDF